MLLPEEVVEKTVAKYKEAFEAADRKEVSGIKRQNIRFVDGESQ